MSTRLRFLLRQRDHRGATSEQVLSVYRDLGVIPKSDREDNFNKTPEDLSNYKLVLQGDVVVNKMKAWQGSIAVSPHRGIVSGDYLVCEVVGQVERRFLHYLLRSRPLIGEYVQRSKGIRPSQWRLYWDDLADVSVDLPSWETQQAIADYLDSETTRIDALIAKKQQLVNALDERLQALIDETSASVGDLKPLGHLVTIAVSNVDKLTVEGQVSVRLCNYVDVYRNDRITGGLDFMPGSATIDQQRRFELRAGDVIITKDSESPDDIAVPALVPSDLPGVVCGYHLAVLRTISNRVTPDYIYWSLRSLYVRTQFSVAATGVTRFGLRSDAARAVKIRVPPRHVQDEVTQHLWRTAEDTGKAKRALAHQLSLLIEHRQALITAAVTGELAISGAAE